MEKIYAFGFRGFPNVIGGVENHCQNLYENLARSSGYEYIMLFRKNYYSNIVDSSFVKSIPLYAPSIKSLETIVHAFFCLLYLVIRRAKYVHVHAIGSGLVIPLLKLFRIKVIFTHHSINYHHAKWGRVAKIVFKLSEYFAIKYSDEIICISKPIYDHCLNKGAVVDKLSLILNGVNEPNLNSSVQILDDFNLVKGDYILYLGRLSEEKGVLDLVRAHQGLRVPLVIAGSLTGNEYEKAIRMEASENVIFTDFVSGEHLESLLENCNLFVLPSYSEGLPISLLEALSFGKNVLVSDIEANLSIGLGEEFYFNVGDTTSLKSKLIRKVSEEKKFNYEVVLKNHNWENIIKETESLYIRTF